MTDDKKLTKAILLEAQWSYDLTKCFFAVIRKYPDGFTSDEVFAEIKASKVVLPPPWVSKKLGSYFKSFKTSNHITKTSNFRLSSRNRSTPLPVWVAAKSEVDNQTKGKV